MSDIALMSVLGLMIVAAAGVNLIARLLRMPTIVGYLVAGLLVGPIFGLLEAESRSGVVGTIGEMGVVLLMFLVGLELNLERLRDVGKVAIAAGLGQVLLTALGAFGLSTLLGFPPVEALFLAVAFSSTVVVVKLLDQKGDLHRRYGQIALGILLIQDLVVIVVLTLLAGLASPEPVAPWTVVQNIARAFLSMGGLLLVALLAARYVLPSPFKWAASAPRMLLVWSLAFCFVFVSFAHVLSLSPEAGAFLAGLCVAQLGATHELSRRIRPLMSFFVAVFFVSLGAQIDLEAAAGFGPAALSFLAFALLAKPILITGLLSRIGEPDRTALLAALSLGQLSEFSLIVIGTAVSNQMVGQHVLALIGVVSVSAFIVSALLSVHSERLVGRAHRSRLFRPLLRGHPGTPESDRGQAHRRGHVIVVGMNDLGRKLAIELHDQGESVLAVDVNPLRLASLPCSTMSGDIEYEASLEEAGLAGAKLAVSALRMASTNALFAVRCQSLGVPVALHVFDRSVAESLAGLDSCFLVQPKLEAGQRVLDLLDAIGISTPSEST